MSPFSTFSSEARLLRFRLPGWIPVLVVLLLGAEGLLRLPQVSRLLPDSEPALWHLPLARSKVDFLRRQAAATDQDVLLMGNSTMQSGVDPDLFDRLRPLSPGVRSFNASIEGAPPSANKIFLDVFLRDSSPRTVVYGLMPDDLDENNPYSEDFQQRFGSAGRALTRSTHPKDLKNRLAHLLLRISRLYRHRFALHQFLLQGGTLPESPRPYFEASGYHRLNGDPDDLDPLKEGRLASRRGNQNFSLGGVEVESLREILDRCRKRGIEVILVNMPLPDRYHATAFEGTGEYARYLQILKDVAARDGVPLWDFENLRDSDEDSFGGDDFADFYHLNERGAKKLTRLTAARFSRLDPGE